MTLRPNKSPQPKRDGSFNSASRLKAFGLAWLRFLRCNTVAGISLAACIATVFFWWYCRMLNLGVDFPFIGKMYCEIDSFGGRLEFIATRYYGAPRIIKRDYWPHGSPRCCDHLPCLQFYERGAFSDEDLRLFERFDFEQGEESNPDGYWYASIDIPYWFLTSLFAILPGWWLANRVRLKTRD